MSVKSKQKRRKSARGLSAGLMVLTFLVAGTPGCQSILGDLRKPPKEEISLDEIKIFRTAQDITVPTTSLSEDHVPMPIADTKMSIVMLEARSDSRPEPFKPSDRPFYMDLVQKNNRPIFVNLDFINGVTIPEMVGIFGNHLNFQFSVDKEVTGMLSISIAQEMTPEQIWRLLDRLLWMNNAYISYEDGIVWVRPNLKKPSDRGIMPNRDNPTNVSVRVFRLKSVEAKGVAESLKQFVGDGGVINEIAGQNALLIIDDAQNMIKLAELIDTIDQITDTDWHRALYSVENIASSRLCSELSQILEILGYPVVVVGGNNTTTNTRSVGTIRGGSASSSSQNKNFGAIRMMPLDRIQGMLVMAATKDAIDEITQWVSMLDNANHSGQAQVYMYPVVNGRASVLAEILKTIFNLEVNILAAETTSLAGDGSNRTTTTESNTTRMTESRSNSSSNNNRNTSNNDNNGPASVFEIPAKMTANDENNYLIVNATPQVYAMIKAVLDRIDIVPTQVELQVVIAEIRLSDNMMIGAEFGVKTGNSTIGTDFTDIVQGIDENTGKRVAGNTGFNYMWTSGDDKYAYLNAQAAKGRVEIVSSPTVMVTGNRSAQIKVGEDVPTVTSSYSNLESVSYGTSQQQIVYRETGTLLTITPRVTRGGLIQIDFKQELSEVQPTTSSSIESPTILLRSIETTMALRNGSTLVVGGLIGNTRKSSVNSLPLLTDVPILNFLFGSNSDESVRTELVVLVTGRIVSEETPLEQTVNRYKKAIDLVRTMERTTIKEVSGKRSPYSFSDDPRERAYAAEENAELIDEVRLDGGQGTDVKVILMDNNAKPAGSDARPIAPEKIDELRKDATRKPDGTIVLPPRANVDSARGDLIRMPAGATPVTNESSGAAPALLQPMPRNNNAN